MNIKTAMMTFATAMVVGCATAAQSEAPCTKGVPLTADRAVPPTTEMVKGHALHQARPSRDNLVKGEALVHAREHDSDDDELVKGHALTYTRPMTKGQPLTFTRSEEPMVKGHALEHTRDSEPVKGHALTHNRENDPVKGHALEHARSDSNDDMVKGHAMTHARDNKPWQKGQALTHKRGDHAPTPAPTNPTPAPTVMSVAPSTARPDSSNPYVSESAAVAFAATSNDAAKSSGSNSTTILAASLGVGGCVMALVGALVLAKKRRHELEPPTSTLNEEVHYGSDLVTPV